MKALFFTIMTCLIIASCVEAGPNFERMSEEELAAYNQGRSMGQMIVCSEDEVSFSRVKRRRCATVNAMYGSAEEASRLGVLNSVQGF